MKNKKAISMSFNWIFAMIAGVFILFLAIYGVSKLIGTGSQFVNTESAAKFISILDPLEAGLASGRSEKIDFNQEVRTHYTCEESGSFGRQGIAFSQQSFGKWSNPGDDIYVVSKYIFAKEIEQGENLYVYSSPLEMPFKIADLISISNDSYCFVNPPTKIENQVENMNNIEVIESNDECEGVKVCFGAGFCEGIKVSGGCTGITCESVYDYGSVTKDGETLHYSDGLLYAAIFSSPEIYQCNVKRLMKKFKLLSEVYNEKANLIECGVNLKPDLLQMQIMADTIETTGNLDYMFFEISQTIESGNKQSICNLF